MTTAAFLAAVDALAGPYLIRSGLRRDKARLTIVGGMLAVCAVSLLVIGWPRSTPPDAPAPTPLAPAAPGTPV